jgi:mannose-6-phosphate isomerase
MGMRTSAVTNGYTTPSSSDVTFGLDDAGRLFRRMLFEDILPLWSTVGIDRNRGGFCEGISHDGRIPTSSRRVRVTARQIYSFCEAARLGWNRTAAGSCIRHGYRFLLSHSSPDGLLFHGLSDDDTLLDQDHHLYDQAFLLFSYAHSFAHMRDEDLRRRALGMLDSLRLRLGHEAGGFKDHTRTPYPLRSNPHMHLLEAALAWMAVDANPLWRALADEIVALFKSRFYDPEQGVVREYFSADWDVIDEGGRWRIEPGHNYEWAWLLIRWSQQTGGKIGDRAERMTAFAENHGVDPARRVAVNEVWSDGLIADANARLWPQTERLKAWLALAEMRDGEARCFPISLSMHGAHGMTSCSRTAASSRASHRQARFTISFARSESCCVTLSEAVAL